MLSWKPESTSSANAEKELKRMYEKECIICGSKFTAANPNYKLCSAECRRVNHKLYLREYNEDPEHAERIRTLRRNREAEKRARNPRGCKICGKPIELKWKTMHDDCIIEDGIAAYLRNQKGYRQTPEFYRCRRIGIQKKEIIEIIEERRCGNAKED